VLVLVLVLVPNGLRGEMLIKGLSEDSITDARVITHCSCL